MSEAKWLVTFQCPTCGRAWQDALMAQHPVTVHACPDCDESRVQLSSVTPLGPLPTRPASSDRCAACGHAKGQHDEGGDCAAEMREGSDIVVCPCDDFVAQRPTPPGPQEVG